ncbi:hypothetical protein ACWYXJ_29430 [Janthinobacterium lividum]
MQRESLDDTIRSLNHMSDAQIAALTFPSGGLRIETPLCITERYAGSSKLPPGPPNGMELHTDGRHCLTRVAIVRIQPDESQQMAAAMIKRGIRQSIVIGAACGLTVAACTFAAMTYLQGQAATLAQTASSPCLVSSISAKGVNCRFGDRLVHVEVKKFFPDGRFFLEAVDPVHHGFTATRITDRLTIIFQGDSNQPIPQQGTTAK